MSKKTDEPKQKWVNNPRERKDQQQQDSMPLRQAASPRPTQENNPRNVYQLDQGKPAHFTLQRNPIKDEYLPNMILFSFVTVVLLEILVPKIN